MKASFLNMKPHINCGLKEIEHGAEVIDGITIRFFEFQFLSVSFIKIF